MAGGNNISRMSPRQKMINLMYIVLTAMLALNVSSDVLNGFTQVHEGLRDSDNNISARNDAQFRYLSELNSRNPAKAGTWFEKGKELRVRAEALSLRIDSLKLMIAVSADGKNGNPDSLLNLDDLEASSVTMLRPGSDEGRHLREAIDSYTAYVCSLIADTVKRASIGRLLSTAMPAGSVESWEYKNFDSMPAIAAVTLLTKIGNDIRQAESEALSSLITAVDIGDVRVNEMKAYVIPGSNLVMRGGEYTADIVLAAIDTTQRPEIYLNGKSIADGHIRIPAMSSGEHSFSGYVDVAHGDGSTERQGFSASYTVVEPMATISPTMMNVLYAGIDNPISISVPGFPMSAVNATMTNGSLIRTGNGFTARPGKVGSESTISVTASSGGRTIPAGTMTFRVRKLPDPSPYLSVKDAAGNVSTYKGAPRRISKAALMGADALHAALDDDILNVSYSVVSFSTVFFDSMGNAIPEVSDGPHFSARQKEQFRRLKSGKFFFITNVKAKGPDGITREIPPMQVLLN